MNFRNFDLLFWLVAFAITGPAEAAPCKKHWVGGWETALVRLDDAQRLPVARTADLTIRQVVRISLGAGRMRLRFSNLFGTTPLEIRRATVALSAGNGTAHIAPSSLKPILFHGRTSVRIAPGASIVSDPVALKTVDGTDVAISLYLPSVPVVQTGHGGSRATSWTVRGDSTSARDMAGAKAIVHWYFLAGIDVQAPDGRAVVIMGDSITDGYGVQPDTNTRWTDFLRIRLNQDSRLGGVSVLNAGIGGNSIAHGGIGPMPVSRLSREVLDVPGVSHFIILEGVNDLRGSGRGPASSPQGEEVVRDVIDQLRAIVARVRARRIKAIGVTVLPYGRSMQDPAIPFDDRYRIALNTWIKTPGNFDAVIDLATVMADPAAPARLRAEFDNDGLHPSVAGYKAMADAVPLAVLRNGP